MLHWMIKQYVLLWSFEQVFRANSDVKVACQTFEKVCPQAFCCFVLCCTKSRANTVRTFIKLSANKLPMAFTLDGSTDFSNCHIFC